MKGRVWELGSRKQATADSIAIQLTSSASAITDMTTCLVASIAAQQNPKRIMRINMVSSRFVVMKYENSLSLHVSLKL